MRYTLLGIILLLLLFACNNNDTDLVAVKEQQMAEISANVEAIIANKSCGGVDDCASIAWGSKPCGGPWSYLVYAPGNVNVPQLEQLVSEYNQLQAEVNQLTEAVSDCSVVLEPGLECLDDICVAK
jgi:hypothetical protein